jgi:hypothetical protein
VATAPPTRKYQQKNEQEKKFKPGKKFQKKIFIFKRKRSEKIVGERNDTKK